ncbi:MAG: LysE family translocator [Weeksellaceae bacterium]|nr:LysE family translocator [Weeksellaceae bacterium]
MLELILYAVGLGIMLSLVFIGPIFFLLIETSFSRGPRHAIALDLGVVSADILCIVISYYASADLVSLIDQHPGFYRISAFLILIYATYMLLSRTKMHIEGEERLIDQNYTKTFLNGFLLNLLNIGVVLFWLVTVISVRNAYPKVEDFTLYIAIVIGTYLLIDMTKIILAKPFHNRLNQRIANKIRKGVGCILVMFSIFIFLQSFKKFNKFEEKLEKAENQTPKVK